MEETRAGKSQKRVAFIVPVHNESAGIEVFHASLAAAADGRADYDVEFIYINDGSTDSTFELLRALRLSEPRITILDFAKNFGQQAAITAGLDFAHDLGVDAVCIMDSDGQDPPPVAMGMLARWEEGIDVVYGQRASRDEGWFHRKRSGVFYWLLSKVSDTTIPRNTADFRVVDRKVLDVVVRYREHNRFMRGIISDSGFNQEPYLFHRPERQLGETNYSVKGLMKIALDAMLGFSTFPLRAITKFGLMVSAISMLYAVILIGRKLVDPDFSIEGWVFLTSVVLLLGGLQMVMIGVVGTYVGRTYVETLNRPLYTIRSVSRTGKPTEAEEERRFLRELKRDD